LANAILLQGEADKCLFRWYKERRKPEEKLTWEESKQHLIDRFDESAARGKTPLPMMDKIKYCVSFMAEYVQGFRTVEV
jgi:hypothetical protein